MNTSGKESHTTPSIFTGYDDCEGQVGQLPITMEIVMKKLQPMAADEQAVLKTTVEDDLATVTFSVKENGEKGTPRYNLTWHFDFVNVNGAELEALAIRSLRIDGQATWRKAKDKMNADVWQDRKWSVRAMLDQTRQKKSDADKAEDALGKLTQAERDAIFAKFDS